MSSEFIFNRHDELKGQHALFSPSQVSWIRYDEEKIVDKIVNQFRAPLGTEMHEYAAQQIILGKDGRIIKKTKVRSIKYDLVNYIYTKYTKGNTEPLSSFGQALLDNLDYIPNEVFEAVLHYINDGISYKMEVEQAIKYSNRIFGHADTIIFKNKLLRIHDLKTGSHEANMEQLEIYAALFCLEYAIRPSEIDIELRMYQWDGIIEHHPTVEDLLPIMDSITGIEKIANNLKENK